MSSHELAEPSKTSEASVIIEIIEDEIRQNLNIILPTYLKNLLMYTGFDSPAALSDLKEDDMVMMESFARNDLQEILAQQADVEFEHYYGVFVRNKSMFKILPGHRKLLVEIQKYYKDKKVDLKNKGIKRTHDEVSGANENEGKKQDTSAKKSGKASKKSTKWDSQEAEKLKASASGSTSGNYKVRKVDSKQKTSKQKGGDSDTDTDDCIPDHCLPSDEDQRLFGLKIPPF